MLYTTGGRRRPMQEGRGEASRQSGAIGGLFDPPAPSEGHIPLPPEGSDRQRLIRG